MKAGGGTLDLGRFRVCYRSYGDGPDVLLWLSGALQTMAVWRSVIRRFSGHFTVVVFDMPGLGRSEIRSGSAHVTVQEQVEVVHALIERIGPRGRLTLAGSSWGTTIASAYAARHPDAVQQLLLGSFGMKANREMARLVERAEALYASRDYAAGADLIIRHFGQQLGTSHRRRIALQFAGLTDRSAEAFHEHCRNLTTLGHLQDLVDLTRIRARTMIVNGAKDRIIDVDDMWVAQRLIPDCQCRLIEGAGHFLHFERPEILDHYEDFVVPRGTVAV